MLQRIDMVAIYVQDWTKALTWYGDSLGFTPVHVETTTSSLSWPCPTAALFSISSATANANQERETAVHPTLRSMTSMRQWQNSVQERSACST